MQAVELRLDAVIERTEGRKSFLRGRMFAGDELVADGEALFVVVGAEWFQSQMQARPGGTGQGNPA